MMLKYLPEDINIEDLLLYLPLGKYKIALKGLHKRNSYRDVINYEENEKGETVFHVGRNSLYNSLPEYMFHAVNRYDNIREVERKERFAEEYEKQEREKRDAYAFFAPFDALLLDLRLRVKEAINTYTVENRVLQDIIGDTLTVEEKNNRFIKKTIPYLPYSKDIRGNKMAITLLLRKILVDEDVALIKEGIRYVLKDEAPKYEDSTGASLDDFCVGNEYEEEVTTYTIGYWCNECVSTCVNSSPVSLNNVTALFAVSLFSHLLHVVDSLILCDDVSKILLYGCCVHNVYISVAVCIAKNHIVNSERESFFGILFVSIC